MSGHEEGWVAARGWEGLYEVSNLGGVRSIPRLGITAFGKRMYGGSLVTPFVHKRTGYLCVNLTKRGKRKQELLHRLVIESFLGDCPKGMECCHNDGDRTNPALKNLRWDTRKGNHADKKNHGTHQEGEKNPFRKLTDEAVREIRASDASLDVLAEKFGVSVGCVSKVRYFSNWRHVV